MALSKEQFLELRKKGLSVDQIVKFESGQKPEQQPTDFSQTETGTTFTGEEPGLLGKARNFLTGILGGDKLAQGAGMALAAPGVQSDLSGGAQGLYDQQDRTIAAMKKARESGQDTSKLEKQMRQLQSDIKLQGGNQKSFEQSLPTNKEVIGSSLKLGATATGGALAGRVGNAMGVGQSTGVMQGIARGAGAGAITGGVEGAVYGAGQGLQNNQNASGVAQSALTGGLYGAAGGAAIGGATGGVMGYKNKPISKTSLESKITPKTTDYSPDEYQKIVDKGRIVPKTRMRPEQVVLTPSEKSTVQRFSHLIADDPSQTALNINKQIKTFDDEVGSFLTKQNRSFDEKALRKTLTGALKDVNDVSISDAILNKKKATIVDNFIKSLKEKDLHTLWVERKKFDQAIENAFGSNTVTSNIKRELRNTVQDFIGEKTPSSIYKDYMRDMSNLYDVRELAKLKGTKTRGLSGFGEVWKTHKGKIGAGAAIGLPLLGGGYLLGGHSRSDSG